MTAVVTIHAIGRAEAVRLRRTLVLPRGWPIALAQLLTAVGFALLAFRADRLEAFIAVVAISTVAAGALCVWAARVARDRRLASLNGDLTRAQLNLRREELAYRERLHDARSAVAGLIGGVGVLARAPSAAVPVERQALQHMVLTELERLRLLLDADLVEPLTAFDLREVLDPVLLAHRLAGGRLDSVDIVRVRVRGRPQAMATAFDNVLRNVRTHAPGAALRVQLVRGNSAVTLVVSDDGPGIPRAERERVLRAGVRGSAARAPGSGLGLHIAARLMSEQLGSLRFGERGDHGTSVIFTLPLADPGAARQLAS